MVDLLFCGMSLVDKFSDAFNVSDNAFSTCVAEEATYTSSCAIVSFEVKFKLYAAFIMAAVRERIFFVGGSDTTSDTTS